ncbi:hypothetical protein AK85_10595 [Streptococcus pneumoniae B1598]|nr:hypothetical protein AK85_10595 [Streptococcus pneumoniae B1598]
MDKTQVFQLVSTVEWKNNQAPDYNNVGTSRYTLVVNVPNQGTTEIEVPVHVYPTASLKKASYTNKQGTLSNGTDASKYVQFEGSADTPNNVTVRWKDGVPRCLYTVSADRKAKIEVVYPGNASATDTVCERIRSITSNFTIQQLSLQSIHVPLVKLTLQPMRQTM